MSAPISEKWQRSSLERIHVDPHGEGWAVRADSLDEPLLFVSGAEAEETARILGEKFAFTGRPAEIHVRLRDGRTAGRFLFTPPWLGEVGER